MMMMMMMTATRQLCVSTALTEGPVQSTHVAQEGGFLELRFVRIKQGIGILRDRYGFEGQNLTSKVRRPRFCVRMHHV